MGEEKHKSPSSTWLGHGYFERFFVVRPSRHHPFHLNEVDIDERSEMERLQTLHVTDLVSEYVFNSDGVGVVRVEGLADETDHL